MHYKRRTRVKIHSPSFYLDQNMLKKIDFIADFDLQSRSVVVLRALEFSFNHNWERSKNVYKKKKKISSEKKHFKKVKQESQKRKNQQESLFEYEFRKSYLTIQK